MDIKIKDLWKSRTELTIKITPEETLQYKESALAEIWKHINIPWFRVWHVPQSQVEKNVDSDHIKSETINQALSLSFKKAVKNNWYEVISKPEVNLINEAPIEFTVSFDIMPKIILWDYKSVSIKRREQKVEDKEIDESLEMFRKQVAKFQKSNKKVENWDVALVNFEWFDSDWNPVENTKSENFKMEVWKWNMIPWFEENTIWMSEWEEKDFNIRFPKDYQVTKMADKEYKFHIKIIEVQERILPEINEDFVQMLIWVKKPVEELRNEISLNIKIKKENEESRRVEEELLNEWSSRTNFDIPESEVSKEKEFMIDNIKMSILQQWLTWEKYLEYAKKTEDDIKKEIQKDAERTTKKRMVLQEIIKLENIIVSENEIQDEINKLESHYKSWWKPFDRNLFKKWNRGYLNILNQMVVWKVFDKFLPK